MRTYLSKTLSVVVPVLLAVLVPLSALSAWVDLEIDETDRYVAAVAPLAADPEVRATVADQITDATMQRIDAGPIQNVVRDFLHQAVLSFTTTDAFQEAWNAANRTAHEAVTAALNGDTGDAVTIDLAPVTEQVKENLKENGVPFAERIPVQHTEITLISADRADQLRQTFRLLRAGSVLPAVGTVVFAVLTVLVAGVAARAAAGAAERSGTERGGTERGGARRVPAGNRAGNRAGDRARGGGRVGRARGHGAGRARFRAGGAGAARGARDRPQPGTGRGADRSDGRRGGGVRRADGLAAHDGVDGARRGTRGGPVRDARPAIGVPAGTGGGSTCGRGRAGTQWFP